MKEFLLVIIGLLSSSCLISQVTGKITTSDGEALPYATIYVQDTYQGTTSNNEGVFEMNLDAGSYNLIFQYVGYKQEIVQIEVLEDQATSLNVILEEESLNIEEVTISANAEDPAYAIIRNAIEKRATYLNEVEEFTADLYIKGLVKIGDTPEKFLGINLGDMEGILDSNRQGIMYLSESKSKVFYKAPDQIKEVMFASKVAGDMDGLSFNSYSDVHFSFYNEHINFGRNLLSPIADNALRFYKYRLEGTSFDQNGNLINKIAVIPKNDNAPLFSGFIYILDDSWRIYTADLKATGVATKNSMFDFIRFKQIYIPVKDQEKWILFSQVMEFKMGIMVFKFDGIFTYFFSNYSLDPIPANTFSREIFRAEKDANKRDSTYWIENRPIPITEEEKKDYIKKDSLEILWNSKDYLDSLDRESNKFKALSLLLGYTYSNSYEKESFTFKSPLNTIQFNAVEGLKFLMDFRYAKWNKERTSYITISPKLSYGTADKRLRPSIAMVKNFNAIDFTKLGFAIGRETRQIETNNEIPPYINTYTTLWRKNSLVKLYESDFAKVDYSRDLFIGFKAKMDLSYQHRKPLFVNTDYSFKDRDDLYASNYPLCDGCRGVPSFDPSKIVEFNTKFTYSIGQTYMTMNEHRYKQRSKWPDLILSYKAIRSVDDQNINADFLSLSVFDRKIDLNLWGYLGMKLEVGGFLRDENLPLIDRKYFSGNDLNLKTGSEYLQDFKLIHNFIYTTTDTYGTVHSEYHLEGKLFDKIPLIKNLDWTTVLGYNRLQQDGLHYQEYSVGIENIGINGIPLLRVDYVWTTSSNLENNRGLVIAIMQDF